MMSFCQSDSMLTPSTSSARSMTPTRSVTRMDFDAAWGCSSRERASADAAPAGGQPARGAARRRREEPGGLRRPALEVGKSLSPDHLADAGPGDRVLREPP